MDKKKIEKGFKLILEGMGEDPNREGLLDTPARVARMYEEIFSGLNVTAESQLNTVFSEKYDEIVILKEIPIVSMCEHHFLPFMGKVSLGYIPRAKISGLSKLARVVEVLARRPQVQERLTNQIADTIYKTLNAKAAGVVIECMHSCMTIRGIKKPGSVMTTSAIRGIFKTDQAARNEFFQLIRPNSR